MSEESEKRSPRDFDAIEINIRINDEIITDEEYRFDAMLTEEEMEASQIDLVEDRARRMLDDLLHDYKTLRDGDESG